MYRVLAVEHQVRERRHPLRHRAYTKPELLATAPNQLWSWDITKLRGPMVGTSFYVFMVLDVFSRYVVGWMVAQHQSAELAMLLIDTLKYRPDFPDRFGSLVEVRRWARAFLLCIPSSTTIPAWGY